VPPGVLSPAFLQGAPSKPTSGKPTSGKPGDTVQLDGGVQLDAWAQRDARGKNKVALRAGSLAGDRK
jgi:hypothetical protein